MRHNINAVCAKFSLQLKQVYKKIHSIGRKIFRPYKLQTIILKCNFYFDRYIFKNKKKVGLQEIGPRFTLKLRSIQKGTFNTKYGEYEWIHKVYLVAVFSVYLLLILSRFKAWSTR